MTFCREGSLFGTDLEKLPIHWLRPHTLCDTDTPRPPWLCPIFRRSDGCRLPYSAAIPHGPVGSISCPNWFAAPVGLLTCPCGALLAPLMMPIPLLISKPKHAFPDWWLCSKPIHYTDTILISTTTKEKQHFWTRTQTNTRAKKSTIIVDLHFPLTIGFDTKNVWKTFILLKVLG